MTIIALPHVGLFGLLVILDFYREAPALVFILHTLIAREKELIGAYLTSVFAYRAGTWVAGKTKLDILLIPLVVCTVALIVCALLNPPVVAAVNAIGQGIQAATELQPLLMGIVIAVVVGILLTLPTSSAAICIAIGLGGLAGGAAVVG